MQEPCGSESAAFGRATDDRYVKAPLADFVSAAQSTNGLWSSGFALESPSDVFPTLSTSEIRCSASRERDGAQQSAHAVRDKPSVFGHHALAVWDCARCTFRNKKHINFCEICRAKNSTTKLLNDYTPTTTPLSPREPLLPTSAGNDGVIQQQQPALLPLQALSLLRQQSQQSLELELELEPVARQAVFSMVSMSTLVPFTVTPMPTPSFERPSLTPSFERPSLTPTMSPTIWTTALFGQPTSGHFVEPPTTPLFQPRQQKCRAQKTPNRASTRLVCSICHARVDDTRFLASQLKKRASQRKCTSCVRTMEAASCAKEKKQPQIQDTAHQKDIDVPIELMKSDELPFVCPSQCDSVDELYREDLVFLHQIGVGGYGNVMAARHRHLDRQYAVKILNFRKAASDESSEETTPNTTDADTSGELPQVDSVVRDGGDKPEWTTLGVARENTTEEDILGSVSHPFISSLLGCFREEKRKLLVFELAIGDLYHKLTTTPGGMLSREFAVFYAAQLLLAIEYLHNKRIIHKDIKLDNVLLGKDGYISLSDFGSATRVSSENNYTMSSKDCFIGTVMFSAPELVRESFFHYAEYCDSTLIMNLSRESLQGDQPCSFQVDYWSFGTAVFEMLTGKSPFDHVEEDEEEENGGEDTISSLVSDCGSSSSASDRTIDVPKDAADFIKQGNDVLDCRYACPHDMDDDARDFLQSLLERNPTKRLGANGADEVKQHPFFKGIDWQLLAKKQLEPLLFSNT